MIDTRIRQKTKLLFEVIVVFSRKQVNKSLFYLFEIII